MIKVVIYDLDDLMVDSLPLHNETWERLFKEYGVNFKDFPDTLRSHLIGMRIVDVTQEFKEYFNVKEDLEVLYNKRQKIF